MIIIVQLPSQAPQSFTISQSLLKFMSIELVMLPNHLIPCCPLLHLPSVFPSIRVFSSESILHIRGSKYWSFSKSISLSGEYSGLISFRVDWFDLLAVKETLKSFLQHYNSKTTILWCSAFFMVKISYPYMTAGKTMWLSWWRIRLQCRRPGFNPWVGKIPWRRERLPTPIFWPGKLHGLYSPWGPKELDMTEWL